ncbi:rust resistance kinase Lr10-like [Cryptomeria japonica]|uniref:rust resistance kinase Lr10-like n=1 Tax=Cryptomeria japonica TaxID=3369 RepID=UPI0027DA2192|nr:rust resistance kinase Lr10-like [Cryptomeria japonica]
MDMEMEGLPAPRFLFLVFTVFILCLASSSRACPEEPFQCGDYSFAHPFGRKDSGCGDLALQLRCDDGLMPLLNISGYDYYLIKRQVYKNGDPNNHMTIIEKNVWEGKCNPWTSNPGRQSLSTDQFQIEEQNIKLALSEQCNATANFPLLQCNGSWHYSSDLQESEFSHVCKPEIMLLVESLPTTVSDRIPGFQVEWNISQNCSKCSSSGGNCTYDPFTTQFWCLCKGGWYPEKCPARFVGNSRVKTAIIASVVIGTGALLVMGILVVFVNRRRWFSASSKKLDLSNVEKFLQDYVHQMPCRYSYSQLMKITSKFTHRVGEGGFGVVYKGKLSTGDLVAVKMLDQSRHSENQFMNEVATIGRIHHVHLVRLMGYCYEGNRNALVYEYMANGSLDKFIFAGREKEQILNWAQLYSIALGAARGIAYLHQDCNNRIIHFDIKPHNILLDEEFTPKVADFGLAKLLEKKMDHISMTAARGTPGYAAPEVWNRNLGPVTDKSDVYSFGMVLLEMVGGRKNVGVKVSRSSQLYFPEWAFKLMENEQLERVLRGSGKAEIECEEKEKAIRLVKVGLWCIQYTSRDRPSMSRVVQMLEGNGDDITNPPLPFNSSIRAAPSIDSSEESSV